MQSVTAAIFRFEHTPDTDAARQAIRQLAQAVARSPFKQRIDRVITYWIKSRLTSKMPGLTIPKAMKLTEGLDMLETNIDRWEAQAIAKGMQQGMRQGVQQGMQQGEGVLLRRQLIRRFGSLPPVLEVRLAAASIEQLETWGDRVLDARSLDEVFADELH